MAGPLAGVRVVELAGLGPVPFAGMVLADLGADVVRVDRIGGTGPLGSDPKRDLMSRGRRSIGVDLKHPEGPGVVLRLVEDADAFIEGFRPGVTERIGLGPDECLGRNPALVYGRMTGFGQQGPLAGAAGHDIDYIALSGALGSIGRRDAPPTPPLNLIGDFGGGAMLLALGVVSGVLRARETDEGQVVDTAMIDGSALLMTPFFAGRDGMGPRGTNLLDSGAPFYDVYETGDGGYVAVGAIEPKFFAELVEGLGLDDADLPDQYDEARWPELRERIAGVFRTRSRDEWAERFAGTDACVAPVLRLDEVDRHPHNAARGTFVDADGVVQPAPAPRFGRTPESIDRPPPVPGEHTDEVLTGHSFAADEIARLRETGAVG